MYRMFSERIVLFLSVIVSLLSVSCENHTAEESTQVETGYFPIHTFFQREVDSLQQSATKVEKTVGERDESETKTVTVGDWNTEMGAFLAVDLSKPAYINMFDVDSAANKIIYNAKSKDLDIQSLSISFNEHGEIEQVEITKQEDNMLYQNEEKLLYIRGQEYSMNKQQQILLLGSSQYQIVRRLVAN